MPVSEGGSTYLTGDMATLAAYALALLAGILAGFRSLSAPAAVSWAARLGALNLQGTLLAFLGQAFTPWILTALAIGELVTDQLPSTPSRKQPIPFAARVTSGALSGAAIGTSVGSWAGGLVTGALGAVIGTLGGYELRRRLARAFHRDRPAALVEDTATIVGICFVVFALMSLT
jgi:uncharacterized membrane protein